MFLPSSDAFPIQMAQLWKQFNIQTFTINVRKKIFYLLAYNEMMTPIKLYCQLI
jgi:hypothetical protein